MDDSLDISDDELATGQRDIGQRDIGQRDIGERFASFFKNSFQLS